MDLGHCQIQLPGDQANRRTTDRPTFLHLSKQFTMHAAKASRAGLGVLKLWLTDPGTFPVLACVGVAAAAGTYTVIHAIALNPDVHINKDRRRNAMSFSEEDGNAWRANRLRIAHSDANPINQSRQFDLRREDDVASAE